MEFLAKSQVILVCRSEIEKTPKIVYPHEIDVLKALHGDSRVELTDEPSPLGEVLLDAEVEFQRLLNEYQQSGDKAHPVGEVYKNFDGFLAVVAPPEPKQPKHHKVA